MACARGGPATISAAFRFRDFRDAAGASREGARAEGLLRLTGLERRSPRGRRTKDETGASLGVAAALPAPSAPSPRVRGIGWSDRASSFARRERARLGRCAEPRATDRSGSDLFNGRTQGLGETRSPVRGHRLPTAAVHPRIGI